jgi:hypothetical protein
MHKGVSQPGDPVLNKPGPVHHSRHGKALPGNDGSKGSLVLLKGPLLKHRSNLYPLKALKMIVAFANHPTARLY